jgi:hypothetical protein
MTLRPVRLRSLAEDMDEAWPTLPVGVADHEIRNEKDRKRVRTRASEKLAPRPPGSRATHGRRPGSGVGGGRSGEAPAAVIPPGDVA